MVKSSFLLQILSMKYSIIPVTPYQQNCTLLVCENTNNAAVVDPGGDVDLILEALEKSGARLEKIFLTHGHLDHVGATAELASMFAAPVEGPHHDDQFWIEALPSQCQTFGFPPCDSFSPSCWLNDGDKVQFGEEILSVLHCPGHTPGHIIFYNEPNKLALVGDVLFNGSIGRTDFPKGDFNTLIASIKNKLWPLGEDVVFIPGHGPISTLARKCAPIPLSMAESKVNPLPGWKNLIPVPCCPAFFYFRYACFSFFQTGNSCFL